MINDKKEIFDQAFIHKITENFKDKYSLLLGDYKITFNDLIKEALSKIVVYNNKEKYKDTLDELIVKRKAKKRRIEKKLLINCDYKKLYFNEMLMHDAKIVLTTIYKQDPDYFFRLYPCCKNSKNLQVTLASIFYKQVVEWKKNDDSYFIDISNIEKIFSQNILYKTFIEDVLFFAYNELYLNNEKIISIPIAFSDIPRSPTMRQKKSDVNAKTEKVTNELISVDFNQELEINNIKEILDTGTSLIPENTTGKLSKFELSKKMEREVVNALTKKFSQKHLDIMKFIINKDLLFSAQGNIITFPLIELVKYLYPSQNGIKQRDIVKTQSMLIYLATLKINKYYRQEKKDLTGFMMGFLSNLAFYYNNNHELIVVTVIDSFLQKQLMENIAIRFNDSACKAITDDLASGLILPLQTLRLKLFILSKKAEFDTIDQTKDVMYINKNTIILSIRWFHSLYITSDKPFKLKTKIKKALELLKNNKILIHKVTLKDNFFTITFFQLSEKEFDNLNYPDKSIEKIIYSLEKSNLY